MASSATLRTWKTSRSAPEIWRCGSRRSLRRRTLENFEDAINRSIGPAITDADRDDAIDPIVVRGRGLEQRIDPEIVAGPIDRFSFLDSRHHIGWPMANA